MIQIQWTSGSLAEARSVARELVESRLVACVNIIPLVESIYLWKGNVESSEEVKVYLKTKKYFYERVRAVIEERCSYDVPEITYFEISGGNEEYLSWLNEAILSQKYV